MNKKILIITLLIAAVFIFWHQKQPNQVKTIQSDNLQIISTKPDPLDNATILANQTIEFNFNKLFDTGLLKFRLDPPEIDLEINTPDKKSINQTIIVSFKKPLKLGSGYTLFVFSDPANPVKIIDKEYIYHFRTIGYRGI